MRLRRTVATPREFRYACVSMSPAPLSPSEPLAVLGRLAQGLGRGRGPDDVASALSQAFHALVGAPVVCLLYRAGASGFELAASRHADWLVGDATVRRKLRTEIARLAVTGVARGVSTLADRELAEDLLSAGAHTALGVSLELTGEPRGLLGVLFPRNTSPPDDRVMRVVAGLAAGAVATLAAGEPGRRVPEPRALTDQPRGAPIAPAPPGRAHEGGPSQRGLGGGPCVLIIDDEETVRGFLTEALRTLGFSVLAVASTTEALAAMGAAGAGGAGGVGCVPEVVLFDLSIPGEDAASSYEALRRAVPEARIVLASGHVEARARELVPAASDAPYLGKPFRVRALMELLEA